MRSSRQLCTRGLLTAVAACTAAGAMAQGLRFEQDQRVWLQLSAFRPSVDTNLRIDETDSVLRGTPLNGESDFGLAGRKTVPAALSVYRIGDDGRLTFARKYNVDTGKVMQFWSGMVGLG